jgi:beta-lactamase superfamily II metal-dependent hydrolase
LDAIVGTHQHQDHLSGFVQAAEKFERISKDEIWLCWLDDPADPLAKTINKDKLKLQTNLTKSFAKLSNNKLRSSFSATREKEIVESIRNVLKFEVDLPKSGRGFKASEEPKTPQEAIENLKRWGKDKTRYLSPGTSFSLPGLPAGKIKVHVLGPPRNKAALKSMNPSDGESYDKHLTENALLAERMLMAVNKNLDHKSNGFYADADNFPFDPAGIVMDKEEQGKSAVGKAYRNSKEKWRKIENEWLGEFEHLSLYLNTYTNNSSLVLAFELVEYNKVLLFAADAQMGNWKSWGSIKWDDSSVSTERLLANTVVYKVGHHCSHNATYVNAFEKMNHPELVALIPVDEKNAKAQDWKMPATKLLKRLNEKTKGRVIRMDKPAGSADTNFNTLPKGKKLKVTPLFIEYTLGGLT